MEPGGRPVAFFLTAVNCNPNIDGNYIHHKVWDEMAYHSQSSGMDK